MALETHRIMDIIKDFINKSGGSYSKWYVGVADNPYARLFNEHGVKEKSDAWICRTASSSEAAREIELYFIEVLGTDGGPGLSANTACLPPQRGRQAQAGRGDENTKLVYAYKKNNHTNP